MKFRFGFLIILLSLSTAAEQIPIPPLYPTSTPSARIKGLGGAGTSLYPDASAPYWNPAMLGGLEAAAITMTFAEEDSSSFARIIEREPSVLGKHISFFSLVTYQGGFTYHPLYMISYRDSFSDSLGFERDFELKLDEYVFTVTTFTGSNAKYDTPFLLGFNIKYLNGRFAETRIYKDSDTSDVTDGHADIAYGNGYGLDAGIAFVLPRFTMGLMARDIITHVYWGGYDRQIIPIYASFGISFNPASTFILCADVNRIFKSDLPFFYRVGAEYTYTREISDSSFLANLAGGSPSFRVGTSFKELDQIGFMDIALGVGYSSNMFRIDIGTEGKFENYLYGGFTYQLSLTLPFNM
ncbi:MAG: hypothetical protein AB7T10_08535 [bacterium]